MQSPLLYGISVGTGDPELITLKALRLLKQVSVVAFPAGLHGKPGIAEQIIAPWLSPSQQKLPLVFPYTQEEDILTKAWQTAAQKVWHYLNLGQDVAFACEGDVSFYSTFTYLAQTLQQIAPQVAIETVPGVCSPLAAAHALGIPLTVRSQRLAVLPALYHPGELEEVIVWADVVVLLKVSSVYQQVWQILHKHKLLKSSWVIEKATFPDQVIYHNLEERSQLKLPYFSLLIVQVR
ncbi:MAG: precorrin-2 C(20)-methyltransferase [Spirulinaceae cyanobacterium]